MNRRHRSITTQHGGFTLVELVLVLVITGVLAAIALPRFAQAAERQRISIAAKRVEADLELARSRARAASQTVTVIFDLGDSAYTLDAVGGEGFKVQLDEAPYGVKLSDAVFNTATSVSFNGYGIPNTGGSITLSNSNGQSIYLELTASGEVKR